MKSNTGASAFSRSKSLREQREYLPAFACREELMMTLRDNQGAQNPVYHLIPLPPNSG